MRASKFQFSRPRITKLDFEENPSFQKAGDSIGMPIVVDTAIHRDENGPSASVELHLTIGDSTEHTPFCISILMCAEFRWEEENFSEDDVNNLLNKNAVSLLIAYSRPMITMITSQSQYPAYNLPYIDLTENN